MPKSKVRKKPAAQARRSAAAAAASTQRTKAPGPSSPLYVGIMLGLMVVGLLWLVVYYLWRQDIAFIDALGSWNFAVGFGAMVAGLIMTMGWR